MAKSTKNGGKALKKMGGGKATKKDEKKKPVAGPRNTKSSTQAKKKNPGKAAVRNLGRSKEKTGKKKVPSKTRATKSIERAKKNPRKTLTGAVKKAKGTKSAVSSPLKRRARVKMNLRKTAVKVEGTKKKMEKKSADSNPTKGVPQANTDLRKTAAPVRSLGRLQLLAEWIQKSSMQYFTMIPNQYRKKLPREESGKIDKFTACIRLDQLVKFTGYLAWYVKKHLIITERKPTDMLKAWLGCMNHPYENVCVSEHKWFEDHFPEDVAHAHAVEIYFALKRKVCDLLK